MEKNQVTMENCQEGRLCLQDIARRKEWQAMKNPVSSLPKRYVVNKYFKMFSNLILGELNILAIWWKLQWSNSKFGET